MYSFLDKKFEGKIDNMLATIQERKKELVDDMIKYANEHLEAVKWDKDGCVLLDVTSCALFANFDGKRTETTQEHFLVVQQTVPYS